MLDKVLHKLGIAEKRPGGSNVSKFNRGTNTIKMVGVAWESEG